MHLEYECGEPGLELDDRLDRAERLDVAEERERRVLLGEPRREHELVERQMVPAHFEHLLLQEREVHLKCTHRVY